MLGIGLILLELLLLPFSCLVVPNSSMTVRHQTPLSLEFPRQEFGGEFPFPSPGELPNAWMEPVSLALQADSVSSELPGKSC